MNLSFQYPAWMALLCLMLGLVYAAGLYWREKHFREAGPSFRRWYILLAGLRAMLVTLLALLLLSPLLKTVSSKREKPIVVLAQDNSQSLRLGRTPADSEAYTKAWNTLRDHLSADYEVKEYAFGSSLRESHAFNYNDNSTNLSAAFDELNNLYSNQNLGALVLATDGIFNQGSSPVYSKYAGTVPVFTIALGDTTLKRDLRIGTVYFNPVAYLGNSFSIQTDLSADYCSGEHFTFKLEKVEEQGSKTVAQKELDIANNTYSGSEEEVLTADKIGVVHYRLSVSLLKNEVTYLNNTRDIYIQVMDAREKILLLAAAPHPDLAAMKQAIETNKNYEADVRFASSFNGNLNDYSLVILHQLPSVNFPVNNILQSAATQHKPLLFVLGAQTNLIQFNNVQSAVRLNGGGGNSNDVTPVAVPDFTAFNLPDAFPGLLQRLPPMQAPYASDYKTSPNANVLFRQKIGSVATTFPLMVFQQTPDSRVGVICGEGLWRWRLYDFMFTQNHEAFDEFLTRVVQYLSVKPDKRQFRVWADHSQNMNEAGPLLFDENEQVVFRAELFNDANEKTTEPDVNMKIKNSEGKEFPFTFNKGGAGYSLHAGYFPSGNYTWEASTQYNHKPFSESGTFSVAPVQLEQLDTRANHQLLHALSEKSGGQLFYANQLSKLEDAIRKSETIKPVLYEQRSTRPLIDLKWIFFLLLFLLSLEWFIRKWQGAY